MKITRSSKCYFNKWLTKTKMSELKDILKEFSVCVSPGSLYIGGL